VEVYANYSIVSTEATMKTIRFPSLDPAVDAALPRSDLDFEDTHRLSDIDVIRRDITVGGQLALDSGLMVDLGYSLVDYEDQDPILVDETGEYQVIYGSVGWRF
jgi:hypothetical protein